MPTLLSFVAEADKECRALISTIVADDKPEQIPELVSFLIQERFFKLLTDFVESESENVNFIFWWQYMNMVSILLQFTRAQRDGI